MDRLPFGTVEKEDKRPKDLPISLATWCGTGYHLGGIGPANVQSEPVQCNNKREFDALLGVVILVKIPQ